MTAAPDPGFPMEIGPAELVRLREDVDATDAVLLLDCRTTEEHRLCRIDGSVLIPMPELAQRLDELRGREASPVVVYCHTGRRSLMVTAALRRHGFHRVQSLAGGIDRWSLEIDPDVPRY